MMLQPTKVAGKLHDNLGELRRRAELESLRPFIKETCSFLPTANPDTASITMEELKKLARAWKLHERRNFWKNHPDVVSMVDTLLQFIVDTRREARQPQAQANGTNSGSLSSGGAVATSAAAAVTSSSSSSAPHPHPPLETRPSRSNNNSKTKPGGRMRQICGLNYFNREVTERELAIHSRYFVFPTTRDDNSKALETDANDKSKHVIHGWTHERKEKVKIEMKFLHSIEGSIKAKTLAVKKAKHLNLAQHLVTFSSGPKCTPSNLPASAIATFLSVAECTDPYTATCALIAIANITSMKHVRSYMIENNLLHKVSNIVPVSCGPSAALATCLFFYYLSLDPEVEDRVYNAGGIYIGMNGSSDNRALQIMALKTLANLMPCGDRLRVTENIMKIVHMFVQDDVDPGDFDPDNFDRGMALEYLPLLLSVSSFTNTHGTLLAMDVFDMLAKTAIYCQSKNDVAVATWASQILLSFLQLVDNHVTHQIASEDNYIFSFEKLLEIHDDAVLTNCMRGICIMSGVKELAASVCDTEIIAVVSHTIFSLKAIPSAVAQDAATYLSNLCQPNKNSNAHEYLRRLVAEDKIALSLLALMSKSKDNFKAQVIAAKALQNVLSISENCQDLCQSVLPTLMHMVELHHDLGAAEAIFNISCSTSECIAALYANNVHVKCLALFRQTQDLQVRETYLRIICQMFKMPVCIDDVVSAGIVETFAKVITGKDTACLWSIAVRIALNIVDHCSTITEDQRLKIVGLLGVVCVKGSADEIIGKAAVVLAYISLTLDDFSEVDSVLRSILALSTDELVMESVSITLYNLTCSAKNACILVKDSMYINIMINIMRSGLPETQMNIAKAMRTLCSLEACTELLVNTSSLSDLIVIALLRSSSEEIKVVCSQAFYNMLIHFSLRDQMLTKGDLYWAITRICKNENIQIRLAAAKALLDLSIDAENSVVLRDHHVFSFVQDITSACTANTSFVDICMRAVQNLAGQFEVPFTLYELTSLILICTDAVARCTNVFTVRAALVILVNISVQRLPGWDRAFIEHVDISTSLRNSARVWGADSECRASVSALLWNLTSSPTILKTVHLADLNPIFNSVYAQSPTSDICENLLGVLVHYITIPVGAEASSAAAVVKVDVCYSLIFDAFGAGINRSVQSQAKRESSSSGGSGSDTGGALAKPSCAVFAMALLAFVCCDMDQSKLTSAIVRGIVTADFINGADSSKNVKVFILELTKNSQSAGYLLDAQVFTLLLHRLRSFKTTNEQFIKYISACIRNISMHKSLVPRLVKTTHLDTIVGYMLDASVTHDMCLDLSVFLFHAQEYMLKNDFVVNSEFALETCRRLMAGNEDDSHIVRICKYTVGEILEKYSQGIYVSPDFVQSMFVEMTQGNSREVIRTVEGLPSRDLKLSAVFALPDLKNKSGVSLAYMHTTSDDNSQWKPFLVTERKRMQTDMLDPTIVEPKQYLQLISTPSNMHSTWEKIEDTYELINLPSPAEVAQYFPVDSSKHVHANSKAAHDNDVHSHSSSGGGGKAGGHFDFHAQIAAVQAQADVEAAAEEKEEAAAGAHA